MTVDIPFIGKYLGERFISKSFWPPINNVSNSPPILKPIRTNAQLLTFINTRRITNNTRKNLNLWLSYILENKKPLQCVINTAPSNPYENYHVRQVNKYGWNSVIEFLRENIPQNRPIVNHLPYKKRNRRISYYRNCN